LDVNYPLDDINETSRRNGPVELIQSLSDNDSWKSGLGSVLNIPQTMIRQVTTLISTGALLWGKSASLAITVAIVITANRRLMAALRRLQTWLSQKLKMEQKGFDGEYAMMDLEEALERFEDMRTNAKELQIVKDAKKVQNKLEVDNTRQRLVPSLLAPLVGFAESIPEMLTAYIGGRLALSGGIAAADLAQFSYQASGLQVKPV
jgi:hypothetical protein